MDKDNPIESRSYCYILYYQQVDSLVIFPSRKPALKGQLYKLQFESLEMAGPSICCRNIEN